MSTIAVNKEFLTTFLMSLYWTDRRQFDLLIDGLGLDHTYEKRTDEECVCGGGPTPEAAMHNVSHEFKIKERSR